MANPSNFSHLQDLAQLKLQTVINHTDRLDLLKGKDLNLEEIKGMFAEQGGQAATAVERVGAVQQGQIIR